MTAVLEAEKVVITAWKAFLDSCDEEIQKLCPRDEPSQKFWDKHFASALSAVPVEPALSRTEIVSNRGACSTEVEESGSKHSIVPSGSGIKRVLNISADEQEKQRRKTNTATGDAAMPNGPRVGMAAVFRCGTSQDMVVQQSVPAFRSAAEI